ncbi:MAG: restriction endonuclease [Xanthobacteraceae bacterium]
MYSYKRHLAKDKVLIPFLFPELVAKDKVISPHLIATDQKLAHVKKMINPILRALVEGKAKLRAAFIESEFSFAEDMTPQDFERSCARIISSVGWKTTMTKATGDQGADVVAEKDGTRLILQCKLYSTPGRQQGRSGGLRGATSLSSDSVGSIDERDVHSFRNRACRNYGCLTSTLLRFSSPQCPGHYNEA